MICAVSSKPIQSSRAAGGNSVLEKSGADPTGLSYYSRNQAYYHIVTFSGTWSQTDVRAMEGGRVSTFAHLYWTKQD